VYISMYVYMYVCMYIYYIYNDVYTPFESGTARLDADVQRCAPWRVSPSSQLCTADGEGDARLMENKIYPLQVRRVSPSSQLCTAAPRGVQSMACSRAGAS
jgi:hypothetical protein